MKTQNKTIKITDVSLVEAHASRFSRELDIKDMTSLLPFMDEAGFEYIEAAGFETFASYSKDENPFEKIKTIKSYIKNTPLMMKISGIHLVGRNKCTRSVSAEFIKRCAQSGIDIFRVYDPLNNISNFEYIFDEIKQNKKDIQACITYCKNMKSVNEVCLLAKELEKKDIKSICLYDPQGFIYPKKAKELVKALKETINIPVCFSTRNTFGTGDISVYSAVNAGADCIDSAFSGFSGKNSYISWESAFYAFKDSSIDIDLKHDNFTDIKKAYMKFTGWDYLNSIHKDLYFLPDFELLNRKIPFNVKYQLAKELKDLDCEEKLERGFDYIEKIRKDLGDCPLVYPFDKMVVTQAVNNLIFDDSNDEYKIVTKHVKDHCKGLNGKTYKSVLADLLDKSWDETEKFENSPEPECSKLGDYELLKLVFPAEESFGLKPSKDKKGIKTKNCRHFNVYINNNFYEVAVDIDDPDIKVSEYAKEKPLTGSRAAAPVNTGAEEKPEPKPEAKAVKTEPIEKPKPVNAGSSGASVCAPMPGTIVKINKNPGDSVKKGEPVLVLEAMKMENPVPSPCDGVVKSVNFSQGETAQKNDVLFEIS